MIAVVLDELALLGMGVSLAHRFADRAGGQARRRNGGRTGARCGALDKRGCADRVASRIHVIEILMSFIVKHLI